MLYLGAFKMATGYDIKGAHPFESAMGAMQANVLPAVGKFILRG